MRHRTLYVYDRRDGARTVHWSVGCSLGVGGHRTRLHAYDREHPLLAHFAGEPPEVVVDVLAQMFGAAICVHCFPETILARLGIEKPPGARAGTVLRTA